MIPDNNLMAEAERLAEAAANEDTDPTPETSDDTSAPAKLVRVRLGDREVEVPENVAPDLRSAFDSLAGRYGSELEQLRARANTPPQVQYVQAPPVTAPTSTTFEVPNPDLLFSDKKAWEREFSRQLDGRLGGVAAYSEQVAQTALGIVQQELNRRETARAAADYEQQLFADTIDNHESLRGKEDFFWAVFDNVYNDIRHLEAPVAYERAAEIAESRWAAMGGNVPANGTTNGATQAARPATPRLLSGSTSSGRAPAAPTSRVSISDHILARQEKFLGTK